MLIRELKAHEYVIVVFISLDIRLNPELEKRCSADARKFCSKELNALRANSPAEGLVIVCLRNQFSKKVGLECVCLCLWNQFLLFLRPLTLN